MTQSDITRWRPSTTGRKGHTMKVFVTGASGWIGSATVDRAAGRRVTRSPDSSVPTPPPSGSGRPAPSRSPAIWTTSTRSVAAPPAMRRGHSSRQQARLRRSGPLEPGRAEPRSRRSQRPSSGSDRPFLFASGVAFAPGRVVTEQDRSPFSGPECPARRQRGAGDGVRRARRARCCPSLRADRARRRGTTGSSPRSSGSRANSGVSGYVGDGSNRWPAVQPGRCRAARPAGAGVGAGRVGRPRRGRGGRPGSPRSPRRSAAAWTCRSRSVDPAAAIEHFGWIGQFFALDLPASSAATREAFNWSPTHPTLLEDLDAGYYTAG